MKKLAALILVFGIILVVAGQFAINFVRNADYYDYLNPLSKKVLGEPITPKLAAKVMNSGLDFNWLGKEYHVTLDGFLKNGLTIDVVPATLLTPAITQTYTIKQMFKQQNITDFQILLIRVGLWVYAHAYTLTIIGVILAAAGLVLIPISIKRGGTKRS